MKPNTAVALLPALAVKSWEISQSLMKGMELPVSWRTSSAGAHLSERVLS